jgi:type II secretory pathway component PulF
MSLPSRDLEIFLRQLATLSQAGVPMEQGLRTLSPQLASPWNRLALTMADDLAQGATLHEAANRHARHFNQTILALINVGELSGRLSALLEHAANLVEKQRGIFNKLLAKLAYPVLLYHAAAVIPAFKTLFLDGLAPALGEILLWLLPFYLLLACILILGRLRRTSAALDEFTLRIPLLGNMFKAYASINFSRCLQAYILSGANLREAILDCAPATGSPCAIADLALAKQKITDGENLSDSLAHCRFLTRTSRSLISTGEQSGALVEMLEKNAQLLDEELLRKISLFTTILSYAIYATAALIILHNVFSSYLGQMNQLKGYMQ